MPPNVKSVITGCLIKFTSIVDKVKEDIITLEKSHDLLRDLVDVTCEKVWRRRVDSFVTNN